LPAFPPKDGDPGAPGAPGKDGAGVREFLITRDGNLIVTRDNGSTLDLGVVVGKDGRDGKDIELEQLGKMIEGEFQKRPWPKDGRDAEPIDAVAPDEIGAQISKANYLLAESPPIESLKSYPETSGNRRILINRDASGAVQADIVHD